jgi:hypothetical protein
MPGSQWIAAAPDLRVPPDERPSAGYFVALFCFCVGMEV